MSLVTEATAVTRRRGWRTLPVLLRRAIQVGLILASWQFYVQASDVSPLNFPPPGEVFSALWRGWSSGALAGATWTTLKLLGASLLIGVVLAFVFTVLSRLNSFVDDAVELATAMLNPLPSVAMLPIAIIWFGLNVNSLIFVVVNAVVWPVTLNIATGFRPVVVAHGDRRAVSGCVALYDDRSQDRSGIRMAHDHRGRIGVWNIGV